MSNPSESIKTTFSNLVEIYKSTAILLLDTESLLLGKDYTSANASLATEQSKNMNKPSEWITYFACKYFYKKESNIILGTGAFFLDANKQPINPIFILGKFTLTNPNKYKPWYLKDAWFTQENDYNLNKRYQLNCNDRKWGNVTEAKLMALDLTTIKEYNDIDNKIVEPLLSL